MSIIELSHLAKRYGHSEVLRDINLSVEPGDFTVIFGLPTSGKSVLVRLLTGLEKPDSGEIRLRGVDVTNAGAGERNLGYVPQSFALYPHMSVRANIAYPLTLGGISAAEAEPEVVRTAELLGIGELLDRKPVQLSGGQKQRVAIARGLIKRTEIYVLDDPLVGLDFKLRERLVDDLKRTQQTLGVTFIYTTSDALETMTLARHIAVMHEGRIVETGTPEQMYGEPTHAKTMQYVGFPQANFLSASLRQSPSGIEVETPVFTLTAAADEHAAARDSVLVGVRPEHIHIGSDAPAGALTHNATVLLREDLGGEEILYLDVDGTHLTTVFSGANHEQLAVDIDETTPIWIEPRDVIVFADDQRIGRGAR